MTALHWWGLFFAAGGIRWGLILGRSPLRSDCTAVLGLRSRRRTHCVRFALFVQTTSTSQSTKRAARADRSPALLVAPQIAPIEYRLPRCTGGSWASANHSAAGKGVGGQAAARLGSAEKRRARGRARSALRGLTRRSCSSVESEANAASSSTGHETEHRREAAAQRRPLPWRGAACPPTPLPRTSRRKADIERQHWAETSPARSAPSSN